MQYTITADITYFLKIHVKHLMLPTKKQKLSANIEGLTAWCWHHAKQHAAKQDSSANFTHNQTDTDFNSPCQMHLESLH